MKIVSEWSSVLDKYPGMMGSVSGEKNKKSILLVDTGCVDKKKKINV